jgi:hypothetical protein
MSWSRAFLELLMVVQPLKKDPSFKEPQKFTAIFTKARLWILI